MSESGKDTTLSDLKRDWRRVLAIVANPYVIIVLIPAVVFSAIAAKTEDKNTTILFSSLATILTGVLGGMVWDKWLKFTGKDILIARGHAALRGLKLSLNTIAALEKRVRCYVSCLNREAVSKEVQTVWLDETIEKLNTLSEQTINSIESWTDILGEEAKLHTIVGRFTELQNTIGEVSAAKAALESAMTDSTARSAEEIATLKLRVSKAEEEMRKARIEAQNEKRRVDSGALSGVNIGSLLSGGHPSPLLMKISDADGQLVGTCFCPRCNEPFFPRPVSVIERLIGNPNERICDNCARKDKA